MTKKAKKGPSEIFVVKEIIPWVDATGKEHFDDRGWVNLGPDHPVVAMKILEVVA